MPTTRLRPITGWQFTEPVVTSFAVGGGLQASDDSDDTYVAWVIDPAHISIGEGDFATVQIPGHGFPEPTGLPGGSRVLDVQVHARFATDAADTTLYLEARVLDPATGGWASTGTMRDHAHAGVTTVQWDLIPSVQPSDPRWERVVDPLWEGRLFLAPNLGWPGQDLDRTRRLWIYEVAVDVVWEPITAPDTRRPVVPPARLFPRDDGLGMSAGTRVHPPPKSQQGGPRVGPGSYW